MNKVLLVTALSLSLTFAACANVSKAPEGEDALSQSGSAMMDHSMMDHSLMTDSSMATGDHASMKVTSEQDFLVQMSAHHREAVNSSIALLNLEVANPEIRTFVTNIIGMQEREITQMNQWYYQWYEALMTPSTSYMPMMRSLTGLTGDAAVKQYLSDMIGHHEGAVAMAEQVRSLTTRPELLKLADDIVSAQTAEITQMKTWLQGL